MDYFTLHRDGQLEGDAQDAPAPLERLAEILEAKNLDSLLVYNDGYVLGRTPDGGYKRIWAL